MGAQGDIICPGKPAGSDVGPPENLHVKVTCPSCGAGYTVDADKIPGKGGKLTCPGCSRQWSIFPPGEMVDATRPARSMIPSGPTPPPVPAPAPPAVRASTTEVSCPKCGHEFLPAPPATALKPAAIRRAKVATKAPAAVRKTILLVEDQAYFSEVAREALGADYRTLSVSTKEEAMKIISSDPPQLMILDLSLASGQDGRDLLRAIPGKQFPILIFTARDEADLYGEPWRELRELGADGIVLKTMNVGEELRRKVADLLESD